MKLSLMSYNIRLGLETSLADVALAISEAGVPDLLALQEIGVRWRMGESVDQPAVLALALGLPFHAFAGALTDAEGGRFGVALLSRLPFKSVDFTLLPRADDEQRVLLHAVLDSEPRVHIFNTHLSIRDPERLEQARRVGLEMRREAGPTLLLGDLNDAPDSPVLAAIRDGASPLTDVFDASGEGDPVTFSVSSPHRRIDYLLCGGGFRPISARVVREACASDHFPLAGAVELDLGQGDPGNAVA